MLIRTTIDDDIPRALEAALVAARPRLLRLARLRGVPADVAEDVVQETLLEAWRCVDRLYDPTGIHRWLDEICRNICRRYARGHALDQRHAHLPIPAPDDDGDDATTALLNDIPDSDAPDPIEELTRQDMALLLDRALGLLPEGARELVELCYLRELPQREATDRLGLSLSALEARLHRARRQLRALFNGPLRGEAEAFGLALDDECAQGWRETRLWCTLCGQRRLSGMFIVQPDGSVNLHMRCADCEQRSGLSDIDSSTVHSKGLIRLDGLRSFRPAWKRTMQGTAQQFTQALRAGAYRCPFCGAPATLQLVDKAQMATLPTGTFRQMACRVTPTSSGYGGAANRQRTIPTGIAVSSPPAIWSTGHAQRRGSSCANIHTGSANPNCWWNTRASLLFASRWPIPRAPRA